MINTPKTQTAVVFSQHGGDLKVVHDQPVTQPADLKPGQALVQIKYSGGEVDPASVITSTSEADKRLHICATDYHAYLGEWPPETKLPLIGGHEGAGIVVAIADNTESDIRFGDRVGVKWIADSCLQCEMCRIGEEPLCPKAKLSGYTIDGTFQQFVVASTRTLTHIPDNLPLELAAPMLCSGLTVYKAIKQAKTKPSDILLVSGAGGGLGSLSVQFAARAFGLRVIAVDTGEEKRKMCLELGATEFVDFRTTNNLVETVKKLSDGGPHAAIIASSSGEAYDEALQYLRPHGTLVAVGMPGGASIKVQVYSTVTKGLRIIGSYVGNRQDAIEALDLAARGLVRPVVHIRPLADLAQVYQQLHAGQITGRVVLKCAE